MLCFYLSCNSSVLGNLDPTTCQMSPTLSVEVGNSASIGQCDHGVIPTDRMLGFREVGMAVTIESLPDRPYRWSVFRIRPSSEMAVLIAFRTASAASSTKNSCSTSFRYQLSGSSTIHLYPSVHFSTLSRRVFPPSSFCHEPPSNGQHGRNA